jgi:hypothetical protein
MGMGDIEEEEDEDEGGLMGADGEGAGDIADALEQLARVFGLAAGGSGAAGGGAGVAGGSAGAPPGGARLGLPPGFPLFPGANRPPGLAPPGFPAALAGSASRPGITPPPGFPLGAFGGAMPLLHPALLGRGMGAAGGMGPLGRAGQVVVDDESPAAGERAATHQHEVLV